VYAPEGHFLKHWSAGKGRVMRSTISRLDQVLKPFRVFSFLLAVAGFVFFAIALNKPERMGGKG